MLKILKELDQVQKTLTLLGYAMLFAAGIFTMILFGWWASYHWKLVLTTLGVLGAWTAFLIARRDGE